MTEKASFGAGCFWGVEETFARLPGVISTAVGYMGGTLHNPTYKQVCAGSTGHAETVEVVFDTSQLSYEQLLACFWECHDPSQKNRQGPDIGTQYRSVIFCHNEAQRLAAERSRSALGRPVATEIVPASTFWRAEEYHQRYFEKNGGGSCRL